MRIGDARKKHAQPSTSPSSKPLASHVVASKSAQAATHAHSPPTHAHTPVIQSHAPVAYAHTPVVSVVETIEMPPAPTVLSAHSAASSAVAPNPYNKLFEVCFFHTRGVKICLFVFAQSVKVLYYFLLLHFRKKKKSSSNCS